jgi:hypothetical protein
MGIYRKNASLRESARVEVAAAAGKSRPRAVAGGGCFLDTHWDF